MEKTKTSKKVLRGQINDSMNEALTKLELPKPSKKVKKLLSKNSKRLANIFADALKREMKKKKKTEKVISNVEGILNGKRKEKHEKVKMN